MPSVQIGAMMPSGVAYLKLFKALRLGDAVLTFLPVDRAEAELPLDVMRFPAPNFPNRGRRRQDVFRRRT